MSLDTCWRDLRQSAESLRDTHLSELLADESRFEQLSFEHDGLLLDLSRQRFTPAILHQLVALADASELGPRIQALIGGDKVNATEQRAALHTALRTPAGEQVRVDGVDVIPEVQETLDRMEAMITTLHSGQWRGFSGEAIDTVVNIGVGGSDLGPLMACRALEEFQPSTARPLALHFVSSMDGSQLSGLLSRLNPATTLFVLSSKSFTTIDTLANATTALQWLLDASGLEREVILRHHFVGITAKPERPASGASRCRTSCCSGTGPAGATPSGPPSVFPSPCPSACPGSAACWPAPTAWTATSVWPPSGRTCRCCWP